MPYKLTLVLTPKQAADVKYYTEQAARRAGVAEQDVALVRVVGRSIDARQRQPKVNLTLEVYADCEPQPAPVHFDYPSVAGRTEVVIVGSGPAGLFTALRLIERGYRPVILERGRDVSARKRDIAQINRNGDVDPDSNYAFGEGGAGTFSDGKLNTNTHDFRNRWVLDEFARHGAPAQIRYDAKPHIGTDILVRVVRQIRETVIAGGGEVRFGAKLTGLRQENGAVTGVEVNGGEVIPTRDVILAIGHSARDTFEWLRGAGISMVRKPFSMGVRIEHRQADLDMAQYGRPRGKDLPPVSYNLSCHLPDGTSAYTFCMCPGGYVFAAASETGGVCTNGMSYSGRSGENANAALLVTLHPEDFPGEDVLGGMYWQREIEQAAYRYAGQTYRAVSQTVGDFLNHCPSTGPGRVKPTYAPGVVYGDLREILPACITDVMENALPALGKKLPGFDSPEAVMTGPETRSSSPVRIVRDENRQSETLRGLYPCGEGAGYAGGITSAAVDGMRCAEAVISRYQS